MAHLYIQICELTAFGRIVISASHRVFSVRKRRCVHWPAAGLWDRTEFAVGDRVDVRRSFTAMCWLECRNAFVFAGNLLRHTSTSRCVSSPLSVTSQSARLAPVSVSFLFCYACLYSFMSCPIARCTLRCTFFLRSLDTS